MSLTSYLFVIQNYNSEWVSVGLPVWHYCVDKRTMLDNLELVILLTIIDETLDNGQIMEVDPAAVATRVLMKSSESSQAQALGDLSIAQALNIARDQFIKTLTANRGDGGGF